jgi:Rps23 Pro-64 3,4-dihydroxylase Tpa1-like proline 4-hydroxylase
MNGTVASVVTPSVFSADPRCPHLIFHDVFGTAWVAALLNYVAGRQGDFHPGSMHNRKTGELFVDKKVRDSVYLQDLGEFAAPFKAAVSAIVEPALQALHLIEPQLEPAEFELTAYGDGGHIGEHIDTRGHTGRSIRVLSCVYYFAATPRRFSGGELRLFGLPKFAAGGGASPDTIFIDIEPKTDSLVVFPSWLRHQVLPVRVPSGRWADARFTVNCWIHRS